MQALLCRILKAESSSLIIVYIIFNYGSKNILKVKHDRKKNLRKLCEMAMKNSIILKVYKNVKNCRTLAKFY